MKELKCCLIAIILFAGLACLDASLEAQPNQAPNPAPDTYSFDIGIYFTGNIQGNIEPCG